jgi:hypothetical protein
VEWPGRSQLGVVSCLAGSAGIAIANYLSCAWNRSARLSLHWSRLCGVAEATSGSAER